jgi:tetratricopeptide (TPR) repeat protein
VLMRIAKAATIVLLSLALTASVVGEEIWRELRDEGDQLFDDGNYSEAAERYNQSFHAALLAGLGSESAIALSRLGNCFQEDRIEDPGLLTSYSNSSALAYLEAAGNQTLENATSYLTRAGYLFAFRGLEDSVELALSAYLQTITRALDELVTKASASADQGLWKAAGEAYYEAGVLASDADDPRASDIFKLAMADLAQAAEEAMEMGGAWNLSEAGLLYDRAGTAASLGGSDPEQLLSSGGNAFSEAGRLFAEHGELEEAKDSFRQAAELYQESGNPELARQAYLEAAELARGLVSAGSFGDHLRALETATYYDAAGDYLNASQYHFLAYNLIDTSLINQLPWMHAEILEILGRGRKGTIARYYADILQGSGLSSLVFFAAPYLSAYDLVSDLGPYVEDYHRTLILDRISVTARLVIAAGLVINHLPGEALSMLEGLPSEAIDLDAPNRALYRLLISAANLQRRAETDPSEFRKWLAITFRVHLDDLMDILSELQPSPLYFPVPRRESMFRSLLADLQREVTNSRSMESYLTEAQDLVDEISGSGFRNASKHRKIAGLREAVAWRWVYQGVNTSAEQFQLASFHACAGESFQDAVLYSDLTISSLGAMTAISAASFRVAEAMISGNETAKFEARSFVLGNMSIYLEPGEIAILLSVLDGNTELEITSPLIRTVGMGFVAGFILLTAYVVLIWEPKHPLGEKGRPAGPFEDQGDGIRESEESRPSGESEESRPSGESEMKFSSEPDGVERETET